MRDGYDSEFSNKFATICDQLACNNSSVISDRDLGDSILSFIDDIDLFVKNNEDRYNEYDDIIAYINHLKSISWCFPVRTSKQNIEDFDRTKPLLAGPLFTSQSHPWPEYDGRFREPVVQFYLEDTGRWTETYCGEGLLQVWVGPYFEDGNGESFVVRVIPTVDVLAEHLSPVPSEITPAYFSEHEFTAGDKGIWPECTKNCRIFEILGVNGRALTWNESLNYIEQPEEIQNDEVLKMLSNLIDLILNNQRPFKGHAFMGDCWFFIFDGCDPALWSDFGYARLAGGGDSYTLLWNRYEDFV
jgi:hypothetical protein